MPEPGSEPGNHYFSASPSAGSRRRTVTLTLPDLTIELETDRGVFSPDRIDTGTKFLLQEAPVDATTTSILDLGTGYGPIAIAMALRLPDATVWATEVNERAAELTRSNARRTGVHDRVKVLPSAEPLAGVTFDAIYSNPPIRIGKANLHVLLLDALGRLRPGGHAYLVVQKHLGSDSLHKWLMEQGWPTTRLGSRAGYRILDVECGP